MPFLPALLWALGGLVASYAITALFSTRPESPKAAALDDFDFPQSEEGTPQSVVFGDVWVEDWTVLWYGNLRSSDIKSDGQKK